MNYWRLVMPTEHHGIYIVDGVTGETICDFYDLEQDYDGGSIVIRYPDDETNAKFMVNTRNNIIRDNYFTTKVCF